VTTAEYCEGNHVSSNTPATCSAQSGIHTRVGSRLTGDEYPPYGLSLVRDDFSFTYFTLPSIPTIIFLPCYGKHNIYFAGPYHVYYYHLQYPLLCSYLFITTNYTNSTTYVNYYLSPKN